MAGAAECRLLPPAIDVFVAAGSLEEVGAVADRLTSSPITAVPMCCGRPPPPRLAYRSSPLVMPPARCRTCDEQGKLWAKVQNPYEVARVRLATGRVLGTLGDTESARRELERACATSWELGATPDAEEAERLLGRDGHAGGLTGREVEVLRLVASGQSNAQIAQTLVLSEKTVARHLSNIFVKLQVGSRTAAAAYAFEHRLV